MSRIKLKAIQQLEQTHYHERTAQLDPIYELLAGREYDKAILQATLAMESPAEFDIVELLDIRLRARMAQKNCKEALDDAFLMQTHAPQQYYGYLRAAQICLVEEDYVNACQMFRNVFQHVQQENSDDLRNDVAAILGQMISDFVSSCNFDDAHILANMLIQLMPTSVIGYMQAGDLFYMQGKGWKALDVYSEGIAKVDGQQSLLMACRAHVQQQLDQASRHDFVMELPPEIAYGILQHLSFHELVEAAHVSHGWQKRIQQCSPAWRVLTINDSVNIDDIPNVGHLVQEIEISTRNQMQRCLTLITDGMFPNLVALDIRCFEPPVSSFSAFGRAFIRVKLKYLKLSFQRNRGRLPTYYFFSWCPYLKHLEFDDRNLVPGVPHEHRPSMMPFMRVIYSKLYDEKLWKRSRYLTHLVVPVYHPTDFNISAILQHCPHLCSLAIGRDSSIGPNALDRRFKSLPGSGLQFLRVNHRRAKLEDISMLVSRNIDTLVVLQLRSVGTDSIRSSEWERFPDINGPVLKDVQLTIENDPLHKQWFGDCPVLENVQIVNMPNNDGSILDGLKNLPRLRQLGLKACPRLSNVGFTRLFDAISSRPGYSTSLHTLTLNDLSVVDDNTLASVAKVTSIRYLSIINCGSLTGTGITKLAREIRRAGGQLEELQLVSVHEVSDEVLPQIISVLPQLQRITIENLIGVTDDGIRKITEAAKFTKLCAIQIYGCLDTTPQAAQYASGRLVIRVHQDRR